MNLNKLQNMVKNNMLFKDGIKIKIVYIGIFILKKKIKKQFKDLCTFI